MERHPVSLPRFTRLSWVGETARTVWEPRIATVSSAWRRFEVSSVARGVRRAALLVVAPASLVDLAPGLARRGLHALPVETRGRRLVVAVGTQETALRLHAALRHRDDDAVGELLGYPPCCRDAFVQRWRGDGLTDLTWPMAAATPGAVADGQRAWWVEPAPFCNLLLRRLGVRALFHLPCHFSCAGSERLGGEHLRHLEADDGPAAGWLRRMLAWPVEWSALHGIAEIRTPVLRLVTDSVGAAQEHRVCLVGNEAPAEAAAGVNFPYGDPARSLHRAGAAGLSTRCTTCSGT